MAALSGVVDDIDLAMLDPADPDERHILIEAEHPELRKALDTFIGTWTAKVAKEVEDATAVFERVDPAL